MFQLRAIFAGHGIVSSFLRLALAHALCGAMVVYVVFCYVQIKVHAQHMAVSLHVGRSKSVPPDFGFSPFQDTAQRCRGGKRVR